MTCRGVFLIGIGLFLTGLTQAEPAVPATLPQFTARVSSPDVPTSADPLTLVLSGTWPNRCAPLFIESSVTGGDSIWIDMLFFNPGAAECVPIDCDPTPTDLAANVSLAPLAAGRYTVYARAVDCLRSTPYRRVGQFQVISANGGPVTPPGNGPPPGNGGRPPAVLIPGDLVVLLDNNPQAAPTLAAGHLGMVVCCDTLDCTGRLLISWAFFSRGGSDTGACETGLPSLFPSDSAVWIDPAVVALGRPFSQCGTILQGPQGCLFFEADDGGLYHLATTNGVAPTPDIRSGDRVRVRGVLRVFAAGADPDTTCSAQDGRIYHPVVSLCNGLTIGCCEANLLPGDRVMLLADNPRGLDGKPTDLREGALGTVVCCDRNDPLAPVLVSWDGFTEGGNSTAFCTSPVVPFPENSALWMACDQIELTERGGPAPCPGDQLIIDIEDSEIRIRRSAGCPNPDGVFLGCTDLTLDLNFRATASIRITPVLAGGGVWEAWTVPEVIGPGTTTFKVCVRGRDVNADALPPGQDVRVAGIAISLDRAP